jgi:energy-coupling factor transporter ATP-binding protein EcfA2
MSLNAGQMELREEAVRAEYPAALALLSGFDHAPRVGVAREVAAVERSPGVGAARRFRSTTPGLVTRQVVRAVTAPRLEAFTGASWQVEADGFAINGFSPARKAKGGTITMQFKTPQEVVGNHIAKYQAMRLAKMLMAYDFDRKLNPFAELGGFIFTFMGDGKPGTGKTTLIQMMAGMIHEYCGVAGYPFRYQNLSVDNIDSYQGKSGQNARAFINAVLDPAVIGFGTIDDIDQIAGKRGDRQSSAGALEITSVLMDAFAGANTVVRGNCTFGMFSNYPENVDDALRQRAGARFLVDGPQTREDYIDILALLLGKKHEIPLGGMSFLPRKRSSGRWRRVSRNIPSHRKRVCAMCSQKCRRGWGNWIRLPSSAPISRPFRRRMRGLRGGRSRTSRMP